MEPMERQMDLSLDEIRLAARRRARLVAGVATAGGLLALVIALALPPVYSATATILVESPQIPDALARSPVTAPAAERLTLIEQRLMARGALLATAAEFALFEDRPDLSPTEQVEAVREATEIEPITIGSKRAPEIAAVTISYRAPDPRVAAAVANEFAARVLEQNREHRAARATGSNAFFKREIGRLGAAISETAQRIAAFKADNDDRLPEGQASRQQELLALQERRDERARRRAALEEQRRRLAAGGAVPAGTGPEGRAPTRRIGAADGAAPAAAVPAEADPSAARARRDRARRAEVIGDYLALLDRRDAADRVRQAALEAAIEAAPAVELALADLHRRLEDLEEQRRVAVRKQAEAAIGERLEADQQGERFEVIEPAEPPDEPEAPNRGLITAGGLAGGLVLGLALAVLAEATDRTIHSPAGLERQTGLRPVVTVPRIALAAESRGRRRRAALAGLALALALPLLLGLLDRQLAPLPVLADGPSAGSGPGGPVRAVDDPRREE